MLVDAVQLHACKAQVLVGTLLSSGAGHGSGTARHRSDRSKGLDDRCSEVRDINLVVKVARAIFSCRHLIVDDPVGSVDHELKLVVLL